MAITAQLASAAITGGPNSIFGCPISSWVSLQSACPITQYPACATSIPFPTNCCSTVSSFANSIEGCYSKNAPVCLDASAASIFVNEGLTTSRQCANTGEALFPTTALTKGSLTVMVGGLKTATSVKTTAAPVLATSKTPVASTSKTTGIIYTVGTSGGNSTGTATATGPASTTKRSGGNKRGSRRAVVWAVGWVVIAWFWLEV